MNPSQKEAAGISHCRWIDGAQCLLEVTRCLITLGAASVEIALVAFVSLSSAACG
jgi:hypothetical protein